MEARQGLGESGETVRHGLKVAGWVDMNVLHMREPAKE